jgi:hypothetical protein
MRSGIWIGAAALLALGACSKKPETPGGGPTAAAPEAAKPMAAVKMPERRAGLWEQTMTAEKINQVTRLCLDETVGKRLSAFGQQVSKNPCEKNSVTPRLGGGWEFTSVCDLGAAGHIESHGVATGDLGAHYVVDITSTTTGASMPQANGEHKMKLEAAWKGACPADMRPGDMSMPGGMKINMIDMLDGKGPAGMTPGKPPSAAQIAEMRKMAAAMKKQAGAPQ